MAFAVNSLWRKSLIRGEQLCAVFLPTSGLSARDGSGGRRPAAGGGVDVSPVLAYNSMGVRTAHANDIEEDLRTMANRFATALANAILKARSN